MSAEVSVDDSVEPCPRCGADIEARVTSAPGYEDIAYSACSDYCSWVGEP